MHKKPLITQQKLSYLVQLTLPLRSTSTRLLLPKPRYLPKWFILYAYTIYLRHSNKIFSLTIKKLTV